MSQREGQSSSPLRRLGSGALTSAFSDTGPSLSSASFAEFVAHAVRKLERDIVTRYEQDVNGSDHESDTLSKNTTSARSSVRITNHTATEALPQPSTASKLHVQSQIQQLQLQQEQARLQQAAEHREHHQDHATKAPPSPVLPPPPAGDVEDVPGDAEERPDDVEDEGLPTRPALTSYAKLPGSERAKGEPSLEPREELPPSPRRLRLGQISAADSECSHASETFDSFDNTTVTVSGMSLAHGHVLKESRRRRPMLPLGRRVSSPRRNTVGIRALPPAAARGAPGARRNFQRHSVFARMEQGDLPPCCNTSSSHFGGALSVFSSMSSLPEFAESSNAWLRVENFMIHPESRRRLAWVILSAFVLMTDVIIVPLQLSSLAPELPAMQMATLAFWSCDIFVNFLTGIYKNSSVVLAPSRVARNYLKGWFWVDALIVVVDLITCTMYTLRDSNAFVRLVRGARLLRMLRLLRLMRFRRLVEVSQWVLNAMETERTVVVARVVGLVCGILVLNHFIACIWYSLGCDDDLGAATWLSNQEFVSDMHAYSSAFHWSVTQFTPATQNLAPVTFAERLFAIGVVLVALITFSTFLGKMTSAMTQLISLNAKEYQQEVVLRRFIGEYKIPTRLAQSVWRLLRQQRRHDARQQSTGLQEICSLIAVPRELQSQLRHQMYKTSLLALPVLQKSLKPSSKAVRELCFRLTEHAAAGGMEVFVAGAIAPGALCLTSGEMLYSTRVIELAPSEIFPITWIAEAALWGEWRHAGTMTTCTSCRWLELDSRAFREVMPAHAGARVCQYLAVYSELFEAAAQSGIPRSMLLDVAVNTLERQARAQLADNASMALGWGQPLSPSRLRPSSHYAPRIGSRDHV